LNAGSDRGNARLCPAFFHATLELEVEAESKEEVAAGGRIK